MNQTEYLAKIGHLSNDNALLQQSVIRYKKIIRALLDIIEEEMETE